jgi:hypothetical protein
MRPCSISEWGTCILVCCPFNFFLLPTLLDCFVSCLKTPAIPPSFAAPAERGCPSKPPAPTPSSKRRSPRCTCALRCTCRCAPTRSLTGTRTQRRASSRPTGRTRVRPRPCHVRPTLRHIWRTRRCTAARSATAALCTRRPPTRVRKNESFFVSLNARILSCRLSTTGIHHDMLVSCVVVFFVNCFWIQAP